METAREELVTGSKTVVWEGGLQRKGCSSGNADVAGPLASLAMALRAGGPSQPFSPESTPAEDGEER